MSTKHVPFVKISRFYDDDILSLSEKQDIIDHLNNCPLCSRELDSLKKMMNMVSCYCDVHIKHEDEFISDTLSKIHNSCNDQNNVKAFPVKKSFFTFRPVSSIAASVIGAVALTLYISTNFNESSSPHTAFHSGRSAITTASRSQTLNVLKNSKVRLIESSGTYIIGEVTPSELTNLTRQLSPSQVSIVATESRSSMPSPTMSSTSSSSWQDVRYISDSDVVDRPGTVIIKVNLGSQ